MKSIFDYLDYHEFLHDFYQEQKERNNYFSYRYMGRRLGLDAGFLVKVLQGKMHLSVKSIPAVVDFCGLKKKKEQDYFDLMCRFGRAKTHKEVKFYFEKLLSMRGINAKRVDKNQYEFYTKWYYTAVRSILSYYRFSGDYKDLGAKLSPPITAKQAKDSVSLLLKLGFVRKNREGIYELTDKLITTGKEWQSVAVHEYQKEMIKMAGESLDRHPKEKRDISSVTVAVSHEDFEEVRRRAQEFRHSILDLKTGRSDSDCVYQVNLQIFPLTEADRD